MANFRARKCQATTRCRVGALNGTNKVLLAAPGEQRARPIAVQGVGVPGRVELSPATKRQSDGSRQQGY